MGEGWSLMDSVKEDGCDRREVTGEDGFDGNLYCMQHNGKK